MAFGCGMAVLVLCVYRLGLHLGRRKYHESTLWLGLEGLGQWYALGWNVLERPKESAYSHVDA